MGDTTQRPCHSLRGQLTTWESRLITRLRTQKMADASRSARLAGAGPACSEKKPQPWCVPISRRLTVAPFRRHRQGARGARQLWHLRLRHRAPRVLPHPKPSRSPQPSRKGTGADESAGEDARQVHAKQQHQQLPSCQDSGPPDSEEQIRAARQRLAAKESALEIKHLRTAAQEAALEATRANM